MTTKEKTAGDFIHEQHSLIAYAIGLLQGDLDDMTDSVNPDNATWRDATRWAHVADLAKSIVAEYEERA